jgi:protein-disulfide isomerase
MADEGAFLRLPLSERDHLLGPLDAPYALVEYADFECGYCRETYRLLVALKAELGDSLVVGFRHFPLSTIHTHARRAAELAEAAALQGKFWELYHWLFRDGELALDGAPFLEAMISLGIDPTQLEADRASEVVITRLRDDFRSGVRSGVNGTPTLFVNGRRYDGKLAIADITRALPSAPARSRSLCGESGDVLLLPLPQMPPTRGSCCSIGLSEPPVRR